jgi:hypothetical protein
MGDSFDDPFHGRNALAGLLGSPPPSNPLTGPSLGVSALFGAVAPSTVRPNATGVSSLLGLLSDATC